ncbi:XdhC family protein [Roseibium polysiphoniae]|uniref:XdhC family protein n=1 Tax=Roseibium polysiphoniae TaxID=2571221 RepID=A0ABR9C749_9HYPH|nr:XdhC/CoxI family protein [Roseibium polysiphoniae]MBD8874746.1 XdhC family protein [Roseibium polysiphoniae]
MKPSHSLNLPQRDHEDLHDLMSRLRRAGEPFSLATVVRTISVTAAKAGAKAVIRADGSIAGGWIGGGCARGAVLKASREALADGETRLISIQPEDLLKDRGVSAGEEKDGIRFASNMCPSQGTMDIFVEPVLPRPSLVILGASPVAIALADLGPRVGFDVTVCAPSEDQEAFAAANERIEGYALPVEATAHRYLVVATQGRGDQAALKAAVSVGAEHVAFVGSHRKAESLRAKLLTEGIDPAALDRVKAPAGLDLGAITPEEIALSILAEILRIRRKDQRGTNETVYV